MVPVTCDSCAVKTKTKNIAARRGTHIYTRSAYFGPPRSSRAARSEHPEFSRIYSNPPIVLVFLHVFLNRASEDMLRSKIQRIPPVLGGLFWPHSREYLSHAVPEQYRQPGTLTGGKRRGAG